jgi:hypothetical protein
MEHELIVTSDEFVIGLLCELALHDVRQITLADTLTDERFESAYEDLVSRMDELKVCPDFSLTTNPYHGDSSTLRETLYAIRERGVVSINNPSFKTIELKVTESDAQHMLGRSLLPKSFFEDVVERHFLVGETGVEGSTGGVST